MDRQQLERLGDELREIGHRRRELAERVFQEVEEGDTNSSKELYEQFSATSNKAIEIIERQKEMFDEQLKRLH